MSYEAADCTDRAVWCSFCSRNDVGVYDKKGEPDDEDDSFIDTDIVLSKEDIEGLVGVGVEEVGVVLEVGVGSSDEDAER